MKGEHYSLNEPTHVTILRAYAASRVGQVPEAARILLAERDVLLSERSHYADALKRIASLASTDAVALAREALDGD